MFAAKYKLQRGYLGYWLLKRGRRSVEVCAYCLHPFPSAYTDSLACSACLFMVHRACIAAIGKWALYDCLCFDCVEGEL